MQLGLTKLQDRERVCRPLPSDGGTPCPTARRMHRWSDECTRIVHGSVTLTTWARVGGTFWGDGQRWYREVEHTLLPTIAKDAGPFAARFVEPIVYSMPYVQVLPPLAAGRNPNLRRRSCTMWRGAWNRP